MVKTVFDAKTGELLGAHMIGAEVTELIQGYVIAKNLETTEEELMAHGLPASDAVGDDARGGAGRLWPGHPYLGPSLDGAPTTVRQAPAEPRPRHPEKAHRPDNPIQRKPDWIRVRRRPRRNIPRPGADAREQAGHGLRGGRLPEHRRVLEAASTPP